MVNITLDTGSVGGNVTFTGSVVFGTKFSDRRVNQHTQFLASGQKRVYDTGFNMVSGILKVNNLSYDDGEALRTWLHDEAVYQLNSFTIHIEDWYGNVTDIDLGLGRGVDITDATLTESNDENIFNYRAPFNYDITLPFEFKRV